VRGFHALSLAFFLVVLSASRVLAQAWLPPKGDSSVSFGVQTISFAGHFDTAGNKLQGAGKSRATNLLLGLSYSFTDRFTVDLSLPYVITKYTGQQEELTFGNPLFHPAILDDGSSHSAFQDFHLDLRYNVFRDSKRPILRNLSVTPFFSFVVPSHAYDWHGESAFGRDLREYVLGVSAGRLLSPVLRKAYFQGQYSYAFVQKVNDIPLNHSNVDLELGYFLPHSLSVRGFGNWLHTHGGITIEQALQNPEIFPVHDRLLRASSWHLGAGTTYSLTESMDLSFSYITYLAGTDTHFGRAITIGTSWNFSTRRLNKSAKSEAISPVPSPNTLQTPRRLQR
jgi:opacity protein-like surface antigen